ncbi:MAG: hypothetical protein NTV15_02700 [Candidatus Bathyarchaeota archaeon]|nr:hypothetical protein [Candidatus Bathyarchaeota archaeon]
MISIITHNDADGLASGGIIARVARRAHIGFRVSVEKRLDNGEANDNIIQQNPLIYGFDGA